MGAATLRRDTAAIADQPPLPRLYSATGTALVVVKWRYIKYLALPFLMAQVALRWVTTTCD